MTSKKPEKRLEKSYGFYVSQSYRRDIFVRSFICNFPAYISDLFLWQSYKSVDLQFIDE